MKKLLFILLILILSIPAFAAASANYAISAEVIDLGGASMESAAYLMMGKVRELEPQLTTSAGYTLEGRFLGIVYGAGTYSTLETPSVTSIIPNQGINDKSYRVVINGTNISSDATAKLSKVSMSDIFGSDITVESATSMECTFDLSGVPVAQRNVIVTNTSYGRSGLLVNGFNVISGGALRIIGTPVNDPNPFNPSEGPTTIKYKLSASASIVLYMFNQNGELIWQKTFSSGTNGGMAGDNIVLWDGITDFKENIPTGVYVLRIVARSGGVKELGRIKIAVLRQ